MKYEFQCTVYEILDTKVGMVVKDITNKKYPNEFWVVPLVKFNEEDIPYIKIGVVFHFEIDGQESSFKLQKQPPFTEEELKQIEIRAEEYRGIFG